MVKARKVTKSRKPRASLRKVRRTRRVGKKSSVAKRRASRTLVTATATIKRARVATHLKKRSKKTSKKTSKRSSQRRRR